MEEVEKRYINSEKDGVQELKGHTHGSWFYLAPILNSRRSTQAVRTIKRILLATTFETAKEAIAATKRAPGFYIDSRYNSVARKYVTSIKECFVSPDTNGKLTTYDKESGFLLRHEGYRTRKAARAAHVAEARKSVNDYREYLKRELEQLKKAKAVK